MIVGHLEEIWQYPVKSMAGVAIERALITETGIPGDRCWAVIDAETNQIRSAKRWPELLNLAASLAEPAALEQIGCGAEVPTALVRLPNGESFASRASDADRRLSKFLDKPARLAPLAPASELSHYRLKQAPSAAEFSTDMGLLPGEKLPDFSDTPEELLDLLATHATPPGTYFDAFPLHLLSTNSLAFLAGRDEVDAVVQRFRANLLLRGVNAERRMIENDWVGRRLQIGAAIVQVNSQTTRCSMPARAQAAHGLAADRKLTSTLVRHCERRLGINLLVERAGICELGDPVRLLD